MTEIELIQYLKEHYPEENSYCEWKEFKSLKNSFNGASKDDVISYVSAIANMEGGHLVIGVKDKSLDIIGFDPCNHNRQSIVLRLTEQCPNLSSEGLSVDEYITDDTAKRVWVFHIPKHMPRQPVYAHNKAFQRKEDSLVEITRERMDAILSEPLIEKDWTATIIPDATLDDLDPDAIAMARE